jgi:hypothetical protein
LVWWAQKKKKKKKKKKKLYTQALSGGLTVPRLLVFLCDYLLQTGTSHKGLFRMAADPPRLAEARQRLDAGRFYDCGDPVTVAALLKAYVRELPSPLVPYHM